MGLGFEPLTVQHDLFVGPGFDSLALITRSQARCVLGLRQVQCLNTLWIVYLKFCGNGQTSKRPAMARILNRDPKVVLTTWK